MKKLKVNKLKRKISRLIPLKIISNLLIFKLKYGSEDILLTEIINSGMILKLEPKGDV